MTPEQRAAKLMADGFCQAEGDVSAVADEIRKAIEDEREACEKAIAGLSCQDSALSLCEKAAYGIAIQEALEAIRARKEKQ